MEWRWATQKESSAFQAAHFSNRDGSSDCSIDLTIAMKHIRYLSENIGPRIAGTPGERRAAKYIARVLMETGRPIEFQRFELPNGEKSLNVSLVIQAVADGGLPRRARRRELIIGAHMDSAPDSPGANDNASGVAVLLELARAFASERLPIDLRLIFFGGEETIQKGQIHHHFGSRSYAKALTGASIECILGMISIDMAGFGSGLQVHSPGICADSLCDALIEEGAKLGINIQRLQRPAASDHESFEAVGIASSWIGFHPDPENHTKMDTADRISPNNLGAVAKVLRSFAMTASYYLPD